MYPLLYKEILRTKVRECLIYKIQNYPIFSKVNLLWHWTNIMNSISMDKQWLDRYGLFNNYVELNDNIRLIRVLDEVAEAYRIYKAFQERVSYYNELIQYNRFQSVYDVEVGDRNSLNPRHESYLFTSVMQQLRPQLSIILLY